MEHTMARHEFATLGADRAYSVKPLPFKPNRLDGLSVGLLESH
jgi:hypothetical protein